MSDTLLNDENFGEIVLKSKKPVLVDFFTTWCRPCEFIAPILDKVVKEFGDKITFVRVDIDDAPLTAGNYEVNQIPMIMLFKNGNPISFFIGVQPEEAIKKWLEENINK